MDPNSLALLMGSAGAAAGPATHVEDVFQTWLYTGNGSTQTITNGVDLSGKGGFVWIKKRGSADNHALFDTARGNTKRLSSNLTNAESTITDEITAFNSSGFTLGAGSTGFTNDNGVTFASWTFRKQAKFFDVVTYVGNATANRTVAHNLGSAPGVIIMKNITQASNWLVYHRSLGATKGLYLNLTNAEATDPSSRFWSNTEPTSTVFTVGNGDITASNSSGDTFVAYLFAHDAGGFGDSGNDSVIKCGTFAGGGAGTAVTVTLGWEPQWILVKKSSTTGSWYIFDNMRGMPNGSDSTAYLVPNTSAAEVGGQTSTGYVRPTATGFIYGPDNYLGDTGDFIYIAIRRGPMKTPTDATKVFKATSTATAASPGATATTDFPVDLSIYGIRDLSLDKLFFDRLRGSTSMSSRSLASNSTAAESSSSTNGIGIQSNTTVTENWSGGTGYTNILWNFRRAPGFFDVVAYTGTGVARTVSHNLGVTPELMIIKRRSGTGTNWFVYNSTIGATKAVFLDSDYGPALQSTNYWNDTSPTSSVFTVGTDTGVNQSTGTFIAYLFASCPGVSKVGSYTGTGTTLSIDCGFTAGARFVMIKRTDSTGDWYIWDTARGIIANNDPYLLLNSTAAEVTNTDYIDPLSSGFQISSTAPAAINANGGTFIYLAVA